MEFRIRGGKYDGAVVVMTPGLLDFHAGLPMEIMTAIAEEMGSRQAFTTHHSRKNGSDGDSTRMVAKAITRARSVDMVVHPAAGGRVLDLVAAEGVCPGGVAMFDRILRFLEAEHPALHDKLRGDEDEKVHFEPLPELDSAQ